MSIQVTPSSTHSYQKGGGLQVSQGNPITSRSVSVQNLALGASSPRIPELVNPTTGSNEVFDPRATLIESDNETFTFHFAAAADCVDSHLMIAKYSYIVDSIKAKFVTASSSGTVDVKTCADGTAISAGTSVLSSTISIAGTPDTNASGSITTTEANRKIYAGQSLAIDFGGTLTNIAGLVVTVSLRRVTVPSRQGAYLE